ncbi:MAG: hypothetical protein LBV75_07910 [Paludibacter sp.]|jgi:hypothetical protein|nr:hypothetical protein [Paludibacter sp.]
MLKIAVDFDGTIVYHRYPEIGREIPFAIETLKKLQEEFSAILILWSVREGALLNEAVEFCRSRGLEFYAVNSNFPDDIEVPDEMNTRKLDVDLFIDDRNLGGLPDWGVIYQMIKSGNYFDPPAVSDYDAQYAIKNKKGMFNRIFGK